MFILPNSCPDQHLCLNLLPRHVTVTCCNIKYEDTFDAAHKNPAEPKNCLSRNLAYCPHILLRPHEAVDEEVDRAVDNEAEVLDGSEGEHPAGVRGEHAHTPAQVGPLTHA